MQDKQAILQPDGMYHVYNRANGSECLFVSEENYRFFLKQYQKYIAPIAETWCYCLMPNHFHFLVRVKPEGDIDKVIAKRKQKSKTLQGFGTLEGLEKQKTISRFLTQQFSHLFNAYTQAFNKQYQRKGSLLMHPYKRKAITDIKYLIKLIHYIHYNPMEARLAQTPQEWKYSSYQAIISKQTTAISKSEVIELFAGLNNFKYCHTTSPKQCGID